MSIEGQRKSKTNRVLMFWGLALYGFDHNKKDVIKK